MSWKRVTIGEFPMSRHATDFQGPPQEQERPPQEQEQERAPSPPLPADHVLSSGAVLFPGAFDQHGCPLVMFPVDGQDKLTSELSKAEVMHFINYFQYQHRKKQEKRSLVSVVADLRDASLSTITFIVETLLLLELRKRTVHTAYILQPKKKDVDKQLLKLLAPSKRHVSFTRVLLKEIPELQNYIDRSQLPWPLGGYLLYRHQSWVAFVKEMDVFAQEFVSVVQRLPSCISTLQALSRLPLPSTFSELQHFCSTTDAKFQQLRRELGLEELLRKCESLVEKLRCPDRERCYQDMAGTALFTQTAFDMLQNHSRITAAVDKVELLWQQLFSKARLQLHVFQLRDDALQITEKIEDLLQEKIQPYKVEIAKDATTAVTLVSEFEASAHAPAMALVRWAEEVIQTSAEVLPSAGRHAERWAADLQRLKEKLGSAVNFILRTLRAVSSYHRSYSKAGRWYRLVLCQNFLQELLSGVHGDAASIRPQQMSWETIPAWRYRLSTFLKKNPPPDAEALLYLAHLANAIPDDEIQQAGRQMSQRCRVLRELLTSSGPVAVRHLQLALQWQYELLRSNQVAQSAAAYTSKSVQHGPSDSNLTKCEGGEEAARFFGASSSTAVSGEASAGGKPPSFSSFDSGFDGAVNSPLEALGGRERLAGTRDFEEPVVSPPQSHEFTSSVSDCGDQREDSDSGPLGNSSKAASLHLEIKVKRSAALSNNPWLSLPVDDVENSYAVSSTQNASDPRLTANQTGGSRDRPAQRAVLSSPEPKGPQSGDWTLHSQSGVEHPELSPMCNILSSTVIEGGDESISPTEGPPTLLWDSYDLHDQNPDHRETEISVKDWALKEQEGLREVEKTLDKASEILEEEENVLAQEAVLDALLRPEDGQDVWRLCDSEDQRDAMSSYELSKAGVLGFEDFVDSAESDGVGELTSAESAGEGKRELYSEAAAASEVSNSRTDLLTELTKVHILDELIMEENLKIHELRCSKESPNAEFPESKPADANVPLSKEALWLQQAREERGAEMLESSWEEGCKVKKGEDHAEEAVKCSVTGKPRNETEDGVLRDFFPNGSGGSESGPSMDESLNTSTTKTIEAISDLKEPSDEAGVQSHQHSYGKELDRSEEHAFLCSPEASLTPEIGPGDGAFDPGGKSLRPVSEPSVSSRPENELRTPRSTEVLKSALSLMDQHFVQLNRQDDLLEELPQKVSPHSSDHSVPDPNVMEHGNSNHALAEISRASLQLPSETLTNEDQMPTCSVQLDLQPAEEIHAPADERQLQSGSQLTPDQPLEFDPGGRNGPNEKLPDGVQSCGALRTSYSGSPGSQTRFHSHVREIGDLRSPIVLDTGSGLMKAGFADQHLPNIIFPTIIGVPKYEEILNGSLEREAYIGHDAQHMRGVLTLKHPIKNGIIHNWDEMEKIWHHTFQQLRVEPEDHPVLLTEAAMNPLKNREHTVEIMFECFNVPFTYVAMQAVLALYAAGRTTGVVFDSGAGVSHSVPVFEGYALPHAVQRFPLAGSDVTMHLQKLLQEQGVCMRTTAEEEIVREMKEQCCCVALNYEEELSQGGSSCREMHYTMPDGQIITLSTERFRAPEILFKPELIGRDHYGMHESVFKSVLSADIDLRRCLLGNIVLSGGNTLLPGLPERLQAEIKGLLAADVGQRVCVTSPKDRDFSVWSGGAVLASLPTFTSAWVSREEYEEYGPQIVFRKCF